MRSLQEQIAAKYAPFFAEDIVGDAELVRAEQIAQQILLAAQFAQAQAGPSVVDAAIELVEPMLPQDLPEAEFDRVGNTELRVLIDCASIVMALQEKDKGKPHTSAQIDELMIVAMQDLCAARQQLESNQPAHQASGQ